MGNEVSAPQRVQTVGPTRRGRILGTPDDAMYKSLGPLEAFHDSILPAPLPPAFLGLSVSPSPSLFSVVNGLRDTIAVYTC